MKLRYAKPDEGDDFGYLAWVECMIRSVNRSVPPDRIFVVKIDNWFGRRWLGFSGKATGAVGMRKKRLTLPPFIPSRVVSQYMYSRMNRKAGRQPGLHVYQRSGENLQRYADVLVPDDSVFWYCGRSARNDRASFMAYVSTPDGHWPWYVGLQRASTWRIVESVGIQPAELDAFAREVK
jgi:hypothetical protein